jgi:DNA-binding SARP family transcriptional activator
MLCYLLLHRERPHRRDALTHLLWPASFAAHSTKSFRQTLWQLRSSLDDGLLQVDLEWIGLHPRARIWLDIAEFEGVCRAVRGVRGRDLGDSPAKEVQRVLDLYHGDLLEGWHQDWCVFERERLRQMYLRLLEKAMVYCETRTLYELGTEYANRALRCECAHERTHRALMRLYYLRGDRAAALRQFERCREALRQDLGVEPSPRTLQLCERIRVGRALESDGAGLWAGIKTPRSSTVRLPADTSHLLALRTRLAYVQRQVQETIEIIDLSLERQEE